MIHSQSKKVQVYYGECENHHYVLLNPEAPVFEREPPKAPLSTNCLGCGPTYRVTLKSIMTGWVTREELDQGFSLAEPTAKP